MKNKNQEKRSTMAEQEKQTGFAIAKENAILLIIGFAIIILGFILMAGGASTDPNVFSDEIFSTRRITIAPIVVFIGFMFEIYAIMKKPKTKQI